MFPFKKLIVAALLLWKSSFAAAVDHSDDIATLVDRLGQQAVESGQTVGLSIAVAREDEIVCAAGFGLANVELSVPATQETVFRIGSITKEFTAAAILLLVEEGKIDLDASLTRYLPDYPKHAAGVTIRHLLQHTAGVKDFTRLPGYRRERPLAVSPQEVMERFQHLPLDFKPGEKHSYCNSGYFLLAVVVEKVSGKPFRDFVEQRLFRQLEMDQTFCDNSVQIIPHRAFGYTRWGGRLRNAPFIHMNQTIGAGNIASTATDLITWKRGLVKHRLLTKESMALMTAKGKLNSGKSFRYGFGVRLETLDGRQVIRHGGGIAGFRADLAYYVDAQITIAVLANSDGMNTKKLSDKIARSLLDPLDGNR